MGIVSAGRRALRALWADEPSALELLVGQARYPRIIATAALWWAVPAAAGVAVAAVTAGDLLDGSDRVALWIATGLALGLSTLRLLSGPLLVRLFEAAGLVGCSISIAAIAITGPQLAATTVAVSSVLSAGLILTRRRVAIVGAVILFGGYTTLVLLSDGYPRPVARIALVVGLSLGSGLLVAYTITFARSVTDELAAARRQLAEYVAPAVASGDPAALVPHRRQLAVLFVDLRGFTRFASGAEPEDVVELLGDYYAAAGATATAVGGTVGAYAGDGLLAWFDDAALTVDAARALGPALAPVLSTWTARGHGLGYGAGIAYGYVTLGTVGFEGRRDYTALGSVVNLASRLSDEAADGEVMLDGRAAEAAGLVAAAARRDVSLKGFDRPVAAYALPAP